MTTGSPLMLATLRTGQHSCSTGGWVPEVTCTRRPQVRRPAQASQAFAFDEDEE